MQGPNRPRPENPGPIPVKTRVERARPTAGEPTRQIPDRATLEKIMLKGRQDLAAFRARQRAEAETEARAVTEYRARQAAKGKRTS